MDALNLAKLSVVVPVLNEGPLIRTFWDRLRPVLAELAASSEIIFVDDGSTDDTFVHLLDLHRQDHTIKAIRLTRNFGHQAAISAGLARATGEIVAVMDGDLQDPPEVLPTLLARLHEGYDVVYAVRSRRDGGWVKRALYRLFYRLLHTIAYVKIPLDAGDFCLMRQKVVHAINSLPEKNRFVRGLRSWVGFRHVGVPYLRPERAGGTPKYTWGKLLRLSLDGILSFSVFPLRIASYLGFFVSVTSFAGLFIVLYLRLMTDRSIPGFASVAILILFIGGVQLLTMGVIGEYLGRIFDEVKQRPVYLIDELIGWPASSGGTIPQGDGTSACGAERMTA